MSAPVNIIITVNSPGEVSGWLKPAVKAIKALPIATLIHVFIPPCTFASGSEIDVVREIPGVYRVFSPTQFLQFVFSGKSLPGLQKLPVGLVLFLGGDLTHAKLLSKKFHYPTIAYTEGLANWVRSFEFFMMPYSKMADRALGKGVPESKIKIIGNLMLDAVQLQTDGSQVRQALGIGKRPILLLMPGSRPNHFEYMVPFLLQVVEVVKKRIPDIAAVFSISPFISDDFLGRGLSGTLAELFDQPCVYIPGQDRDGTACLETPGLIKTKNGELIPAIRGRQYELMAAANLAVSLPGTNTFELAAYGVPMIVVLPLNYPERVPMEGIIGLIGGIPVVGKIIKRSLFPKMLAKMKFTAWPNRLARDFIVPELRGIITTETIVAEIERLLTDPSESSRISKQLQEVVGEQGAANRLAQLVLEVLHDKFSVLSKERE